MVVMSWMCPPGRTYRSASPLSLLPVKYAMMRQENVSHGTDHVTLMLYPPPSPSASVTPADRKPPPLIQAASSDATPTSSGQQVSPGEQRKRNSKGGAKRKKYCTEDERLGKEKERRCANNQRERSVWEGVGRG